MTSAILLLTALGSASLGALGACAVHLFRQSLLTRAEVLAGLQKELEALRTRIADCEGALVHNGRAMLEIIKTQEKHGADLNGLCLRVGIKRAD